jgi:hypothetical protein
MRRACSTKEGDSDRILVGEATKKETTRKTKT